MIVVTTFLLFSGFFLPLKLYLSPKSGLGYALGIFGTSMMGLLFLYSARKRFSFLIKIATIRMFFEWHVFFGIFGPILILYHCCYSLGAPNSNVALWSMLTVFISGFVGKFLYQRTGWELPFKWWHVVHLPFVGMLVMAATVHIVASFLY